MKRFVCFLICFLFFCPFSANAVEITQVYPYDAVMNQFWFTPASAEYVSDGDAKALLLMEFSTGRILFAENEKEHLPIASVTKVISTLLVMEAIDEGKITLDDVVTVSDHAAGMGGSQIYLEPNETMTVNDLLKSLVVVSANDATVALGEYICGSESAFVSAMNKRAQELGCENSNFVNTNGLPVEGQYSCALDVALITRELMKHEKIFDYTGIWMDTIRNGTFGLANTNKLVRFYKGATGMKTGFTGEAKYCLSGTAKRDGMHLIAVVLGASTSEKRFAAAKGLLDYGFANYSITAPEVPELSPVAISRGVKSEINVETEQTSVLLEKGTGANIESKVIIEENLKAPIEAGASVGRVEYYRNGQEVAREDIIACEDVDEVSYGSILSRIFKKIFFKK